MRFWLVQSTHATVMCDSKRQAERYAREERDRWMPGSAEWDSVHVRPISLPPHMSRRDMARYAFIKGLKAADHISLDTFSVKTAMSDPAPTLRFEPPHEDPRSA